MEPTGTQIQPQPPTPPARRGWGAFTPRERAAIMIVLGLVLVGGIVAGIVTAGDHGTTDVTSTPTSSTTSTSTTEAPTTTSTSSTTTTTIGADLLSQLRAALRGTDAEGVVTDVHANVLHNLQVGTSLSTSTQAQAVAVEVCKAGKALGYTDVRVRAANGKTLVSTGVFDNDCQRR